MHSLKIFCSAVSILCISTPPVNPPKVDRPSQCEKYEWRWNDRHIPKTKIERERDMREWKKLNCPLG